MESISRLANRITHILKEFELSNRQLAKLADISPQTIGDILDGTQKTLKPDKLKNISEKLDISESWMVYGKGEPPKKGLGDSKEVITESIGYSKTKSLNKIYQPEEAYYVPTPAIAGFLNSMTDPTFYQQLSKVQLPPEYQTINWVFEVDGDSMYPTFSNGDHIGCRKVFNTRIIRFGEPYIVDCGEGGLMLKRLYPLKDEFGKTDKDILILRSDNNGYPDMEVYKSDIKHLFLVTTRISKNVGQKRSYEDQIIKMAKDLEIIKKGIK